MCYFFEHVIIFLAYQTLFGVFFFLQCVIFPSERLFPFDVYFFSNVSFFLQRIILSPTYHPFFQRIIISPTYQHIILSLTCYSFSIVSSVLRRVFLSTFCHIFFGLSYFPQRVIFSGILFFLCMLFLLLY